MAETVRQVRHIRRVRHIRKVRHFSKMFVSQLSTDAYSGAIENVYFIFDIIIKKKNRFILRLTELKTS